MIAEGEGRAPPVRWRIHEHDRAAPPTGTNVIVAISIHEPTGARARRPSVSAFGLTTLCRRAAVGPHAARRSPASLREARLRRAASSRRYQQRSVIVACLGRRTGGARPSPSAIMSARPADGLALRVRHHSVTDVQR